MAMKKGYLSEYFEAVVVKTLSAVDANPKKSNQHEVGGSAGIVQLLGPFDPKVTFDVTYVWLGEENESISSVGTASWYDTRLNQPHRKPEPRLYYPSNPVTELMSEGDTLIIAKRPGGSLFFIVVSPGSTIESQLLWLFGIDGPTDDFVASKISGDTDAAMDFAARFILDELGIEFEDPEANTIDALVKKFATFPPTKQFSELARMSLPKVLALDDPDEALMAWIEQEERMFRRLEKRLVSNRLKQGFLEPDGEADVDSFIQYSLVVQNRRKSRMGYAFEHHLSAVLDAWKIKYQRGAVTEHGTKPDFLLPNQQRYDDPAFDPALLAMIGAKSTCKDRWRQVAFEADKVKLKHLVTLEPAISEVGTKQMAAAGVQLVLPTKLHTTYNESQQKWLWSLRGLVDHLVALQKKGS